MPKTIILAQIQEAIRLCREAGRQPIALLINPVVSGRLTQELVHERENYPVRIVDLDKLFGLTVFEHRKVKDFYLVDNRSWAEQKW
jgi:hypothetical protein